MTSIDDDFKNIFEKLFEQMGIDPKIGLNGLGPETKSWYYGYSMTMGPDGKPVIREYGNMNPNGNLNPTLGFGDSLETNIGNIVDEPLTQVDVDRKQMKVRVLVELPGFDRDSIKINAREKTIKIIAREGGREFVKEVPLGVSVDPDSAKASLNNGVLDISIRLIEGSVDDGVDVQVE
jgi:HSP20 family protein